MNEGEITMSDFQEEMKRLSPGIQGQGKAIAKIVGIGYSGYRKYHSSRSSGKTSKSRRMMYKILLAAKAVYREPIDNVAENHIV